MTKSSDCSGGTGGTLFTCLDGEYSRAITHWPAVAKYASITDTCGTWADQVVAYNPNCTLSSNDKHYQRAVCRENTLLYADYGSNCSSVVPTTVHEKYRVHHCSTKLSTDGPDAWSDDDDAGQPTRGHHKDRASKRGGGSAWSLGGGFGGWRGSEYDDDDYDR